MEILCRTHSLRSKEKTSCRSRMQRSMPLKAHFARVVQVRVSSTEPPRTDGMPPLTTSTSRPIITTSCGVEKDGSCLGRSAQLGLKSSVTGCGC